MGRFLFHRSFQTVIHFVLIDVFTFSMIIGWSIIGWIPPAQSQLPSLPTAASNAPLKPPIGVTRNGEYEMAPVKSPSFVMAGLRGTLGYYLSGLIFGLGYFWFFVDSQQEAWHDKIFDTVVLADRGQI